MNARAETGLRAGARAAAGIVPTFVAIFAGFGIAAQVAHVPIWAALLMTAVVFAAPAQFAMIDAAGVPQMIAAAIIVNLRFFLMSLTLTQLFPRGRRARQLVWAHFLAASTYLLTFFAARRLNAATLHDYYRGVALVAFPAALVGTVLGVTFGTGLPPHLAFGATLFLPIYFALLLANEVRGRYEITAASLGFVLTPFAEYLLPEWGLFLTALLVGAAVSASER